MLLQLGQAAREDEEPPTHQTVSWTAFTDHLSANIGPITGIGGLIDLEAAVRHIMERVYSLHPLTAEENEDPMRPASTEEVKATIKSFRPNKAPGPDGITYRALKHAPRKFVMHMTNICNAMLRLRHSMEASSITTIPKPGQHHNWPQNYRPISLLPVVG
ncbi:hypothetical protein Trydic_g21892 [Trypoxylus dichotomus]